MRGTLSPVGDDAGPAATRRGARVRSATRRRVTLALIGLLALALVGWFVQQALTDGASEGSRSAATDGIGFVVTEISRVTVLVG